jgi:hypothetical protein
MLKGCTGHLHAVISALREGRVSKARPYRKMAQLVAHLHGVQGVGGSSPLFPTVLEVGVGVLRQIVALVFGGSIPLKHLNDEKRLFSVKNVYYSYDFMKNAYK